MSARTRAAGTKGPVRRGHAIEPVPAANVAAGGGGGGGGGATLPINLATDVSGDLPFANLTQIAGLSVLGVTGSSTADVAAITAGSDGQVLLRSGTTLAFGSVSLTAGVTGRLPLANVAQGTALSVLGVTGNATADYADIVAASDGQVLRRSGTAVSFGAISLSTAAAVTGKLPWANLADVSATSRILGRVTAGAGTIEELMLTQALDLVGSAARGDILFRGASSWQRLGTGSSGQFLQSQGVGADLQWGTLTGATVGVGAFYTGAGHPQGSISAAIGAHYIDTNNGYAYRKVGGGSTAYGWYFIPIPGVGPVPFFWVPGGVQAINSNARGNGYGAFVGSVADAVDSMTYSNVTTATELIGQPGRYVRFASAATSGTNTFMSSQTGNNRLYLDDDIDIWVDMITDASAVTTVRYWFGLSSASISDVATLGSSSNGAMCIKFSTVAGEGAAGGTDGGWVGYTSKNGAGNQSFTGTVASIAAATKYRLRLRFIRAGTPTVFFSVNDSTETSLTTQIPSTGSNFFMVFGLTAKANAARSFAWKQFGGAWGAGL